MHRTKNFIKLTILIIISYNLIACKNIDSEISKTWRISNVQFKKKNSTVLISEKTRVEEKVKKTYKDLNNFPDNKDKKVSNIFSLEQVFGKLIEEKELQLHFNKSHKIDILYDDKINDTLYDVKFNWKIENSNLILVTIPSKKGSLPVVTDFAIIELTNSKLTIQTSALSEHEKFDYNLFITFER